MEIKDRIKVLRLKKNFTQKQLGDLVGVSAYSVSCWEAGTKSPSIHAIIAMSNIFNIATDCLLGTNNSGHVSDLSLKTDELKLLNDYRTLDKHGKIAVKTVCKLEKDRVNSEAVNSSKLRFTNVPNRYIPRYTNPAAAGYSAPLDGEDYEMIPVEKSVPRDADFAVIIQGNSMYPYICDGDTVYVKRDKDLSIGDIGIFCVDGSMYCKQYYIDDIGNLVLASANPELCDSNIIIAAESGSCVECYGKVIISQKVSLPDYLMS